MNKWMNSWMNEWIKMINMDEFWKDLWMNKRLPEFYVPFVGSNLKIKADYPSML